mgnify:FL=1
MAICRNIQNNDLYRYLGNDEYKNLRTGNTGKIDPETAKKVLKINIEATEMINENPIVEDLIKSLNLKFEK